MVKFTPRQLTENVNVSKVSPKKEFFVLLSGILLVLAVIYLLSGLVLNIIIDRAPYKLDNVLARFIKIKEFSIKEEFVPDKEKIQKLLDELIAFLPNDQKAQYTVDIVEGQEINALALPGRHIVLLAGLLNVVNSENEVSFILAHELGHFAYKDHLRAFGRGVIFVFFATVLVGNNSGLNDFFSGALRSMDLSFSREQEKRADIFALNLLEKRYGHVGGAIDFFEMMNRKDKLPKFLLFGSTHPLDIKRLEYINDLIDENKYKVGPVVPLKFVRSGKKI